MVDDTADETGRETTDDTADETGRETTDDTGRDMPGGTIDDIVVRPIEQAPTRPQLLARGFTRRCGWCGDRRAYFRGWFQRQDRCRACGHVYRRGDDAFELGAITANIILTFGSILIAILVLVAVTAPDVPTFGIVVVTGAIALVGPALFYPLSFTLWQAVDLWMRRPTPGELRGEDDGRL